MDMETQHQAIRDLEERGWKVVAAYPTFSDDRASSGSGIDDEA